MMMDSLENRPRIRPALTNSDKLVEAIGYVLLAAMWVLTVVGMLILPETIPTHYGFSGTPDAFGSKYTYITLPLVGTVLFFLLTVLNRYPWIFNYPSALTGENALMKYRNATRALRLLKLLLQLIFFGIQLFTLFVALHQLTGLGWWFLPLVIVLCPIPILMLIFGGGRKKPI